jgi:thioesterase domain-containing protein
VVLFRSEQSGAPDLGWAPLCTNLKIIRVTGDHDTMFDGENLDALTTHFQSALM